MKYLRFVLESQSLDTGVQDGIFRHAYELLREGELQAYERTELESLLSWFDSNLAVPSRFNRTKSKGYYRRKSKGISWLKPSASAHIAKMRQIASILGDRGIGVSMIRSSRPGYVVYEDNNQVVAEPFGELRRK